MAGSRRTFIYTDDNGTQYGVQLDESIYENTNLGFKTTATNPAALTPLIRGIPVKMRYINCYRIEGNATIRAKFYIGAVDNTLYKQGGLLQFGASATANAAEGGPTWVVTSSRGEKRRFLGLQDTGKTDGDVDIIATPNAPAP